MIPGQPAVTLVRVTARKAGGETYVAVWAGDALPILGQFMVMFDSIADRAGAERGELDIDTMPWSVLPGARRLAAAKMAGASRGEVLFLGTAIDGKWVTWHLPMQPPPAPS
jgi:hypothetical protein